MRKSYEAPIKTRLDFGQVAGTVCKFRGQEIKNKFARGFFRVHKLKIKKYIARGFTECPGILG